jgi:hypothetical protein
MILLCKVMKHGYNFHKLIVATYDYGKIMSC